MNASERSDDLPVWNYDADPHIPELYDRSEGYTDDLDLIRLLIGDAGPLRIFEPFCGTGRILLPLAQDGHTLTGMDTSRDMLERARGRLRELSANVQARVTFWQGDALMGGWPAGQDLVVLGGNCFYELPTEAEQEACVRMAAAGLRPGGHVYVDNNHRRAPVSPDEVRSSCSWPEGTCDDGTHLHGELVCVSVDADRNYAYYKRILTVATPDGRVSRSEWRQQKHPVSGEEVRRWLEQHGFAIERMMGDRKGSPWTPDSGRAIFWARLKR